MLGRRIITSLTKTSLARYSSQNAAGPTFKLAKFEGQTPTSFIHDGYATSRVPFIVHNKWKFAVKAVLFLAVGFWAPFVIVEYHLNKNN